MSVFDGIAELIGDIIVAEGLGKAILYTLVGEGAGYNPSTSRAAPSQDPKIITAVVGACAKALRDGVTVEDGDLQLTIAASELTFEPASGDTAEIDGVQHVVLVAKPTYGGAEIIVWDIQCRRGAG